MSCSRSVLLLSFVVVVYLRSMTALGANCDLSALFDLGGNYRGVECRGDCPNEGECIRFVTVNPAPGITQSILCYCNGFGPPPPGGCYAELIIYEAGGVNVVCHEEDCPSGTLCKLDPIETPSLIKVTCNCKP